MARTKTRFSSVKLCEVSGCGVEKRALGYCEAHYSRARAGKPLDTPIERKAPRLCTAVNCDRAHYARGYCRPHYKRVVRIGTAYLPELASDEERFWSRVDKTESCWLWTGAISDTGYASFATGQKSYSGHRYLYELVHGKQPSDMHLDHLCRVRRCVNPAHLELVTPAENINRGLNARRSTCARGHDMANAYVRPDGTGRFCRICARDRDRKRRQNVAEKNQDGSGWVEPAPGLSRRCVCTTQPVTEAP